MEIIFRIYKKIISFFFSPEKYARKIGVKIGKDCEIYKNIFWGSEPYLIEIGNSTRITTECKFITHDGGVWTLRKLKLIENSDVFGRIKIGNNCHIGIGTIIMPNVTIGNNCIIGCGAVVTKDIPDNTVAVGVPARPIKTIDEYFQKQQKICDFTKNLNYKEKRKYLEKKYNLEEKFDEKN